MNLGKRQRIGDGLGQASRWQSILPFLKSAPQYFKTASLKGGTSATATVTAVATAYSAIIPMGIESDAGADDTFTNCALTFAVTDATTVTCARNGNDNTFEIYGYGLLLEFNPEYVKFLQTGSTSVNATPKDQALSATVDPLHTIAFLQGFKATNASWQAIYIPTLKVKSDGTAITFTPGSGALTTSCNWTVVESRV